MNNVYFVLIILLSCTFVYSGSIEGTVKNVNDNNILINVNIKILNYPTGTTTDTNGKFILNKLRAGQYKITISHIGFRSETRTVKIHESETIKLEIKLAPVAVPLNEIVVTSIRYKKQLKDVPIPLNVVRKEKIEQTAPQDVANILSTQPGISLSRDGIWGTHVNIRGLSRNNIVLLVDANRIDTATDLAAGLSMIDVNDVERIEVIKGAASSLYGSGAVGGVVNIITQQGWYAVNPYLKVNFSGGYGTVNRSSFGNFFIKSGAPHWYLSLSGMARKAENTKTPHGVIPNSQFQDENISVKTGVRYFNNHEIKLNYQRFYAQDVGIPGGYPLFPAIAEVRYPEEKREMLSVEYIIKNVTPLLSSVSFKYFKQNIIRDVENFPHLVNNLPALNGQPPKRINVLSVTPAAFHNTNGIQIQTDWILNKNQHLIVGMDAWQKNLDSHREKNIRIDILNPVDGSVKSSINQVIGERPLPVSYYRSIGIYLQDEFNLHKKLSMTIGGRYDKINVENEKTLNPLYQIVNSKRNDTPPNQTVLWDKITTQNNSWSSNLGILYHLSDIFDVTLSLGQSFRSPSLEERYKYIDLGNVVKIGDPFLKPEKGLFSDAGIRMWYGDVSFVGNLFYNKLKNLVIETPTTFEGRNAFINSNVGKAELYGFDFETMFTLSKHLRLYTNVAYIYGQDIYNNVPLPLISPLNGKLGLSGNLFKYFDYEISVSIFGKQDRIAEWEYKTPNYTYIDLYVSTISLKILSLESRLYLGVENLADRAYRNHLSTNRGKVTIEPGRNFNFRWQIGY